ncbi:MAG TPA: ERAP1-like C-terminal domain-containing protein [Rhizomicrobium sp.]
MFAAYRNSNDEYFRRSLINAMAGSEDRAFLRKFLAMALTPRVRIGEIFYLYQFWPSEPVARDELWQWITGDFEAVKKRISAEGFSEAPGIMADACEARAISKVDGFFRPKIRELQGTERTLAQAKEKIEACIAFKSAKAIEISAALNAAH